MTTSGLNKRLDRLQAPGDWRRGIGDRLNRALAEQRAKHEEYRRLGLTEAEIKAREADELREWLKQHPQPDSALPDNSLEKRLHAAIAGLVAA